MKGVMTKKARWLKREDVGECQFEMGAPNWLSSGQ